MHYHIMNAYFTIMYMKFDAIRFTNVHVIYHFVLFPCIQKC